MEKAKNILLNLGIGFIFIVVTLIGIYTLYQFTPEKITEKPLPAVNMVEKFLNKVNDVGESCGSINGNCKVCLVCVDTNGKLEIDDFRDGNKRSGTCQYIKEGNEDEFFCSFPYKRCNGIGDCVECIKDSDCGDCSLCAKDFFNYPGQKNTGKCIPQVTKNSKKCNINYQLTGVCYHGDCVECIKDSDCTTLQCDNNICI